MLRVEHHAPPARRSRCWRLLEGRQQRLVWRQQQQLLQRAPRPVQLPESGLSYMSDTLWPPSVHATIAHGGLTFCREVGTEPGASAAAQQCFYKLLQESGVCLYGDPLPLFLLLGGVRWERVRFVACGMQTGRHTQNKCGHTI
jgi:hypothetical protein